MARTDIVLLTVVLVVFASAQLSKYADWKPGQLRYCETVNSKTDSSFGGTVCGNSSFNLAATYYPELAITSQVSMGLIQVGWLTSNALGNQSGFWNTCKPYLVRLYDGIYQNITNACALIGNPPAGLPQCEDNMTNLLLRSGSGYCLKSKVCGAFSTVDFYKSADGSSLLWTWLNSVAKGLIARGFTKTGSCYGYTKQVNDHYNWTNMADEDAKGIF